MNVWEDAAGVSMVLEDRSNSTDPNFLTGNLYKFLGAVNQRPEIAAAIPTYFPAVPQLFVDVDREKVAQQQVNIGDVYTTLQAFLGGSLVNYFNRFGRQWQTYVEAEGDTRTNIDNIGQFYVTAANGNRVPLSSITTVRRITGTSHPQLPLNFSQSKELPVATMQRSITPLIQKRDSQPARKSGEVRVGRPQSVARRSLHPFAPVLRVQLERTVPGPFKIKP
jgi:HAE1 family hydrophobic/amphiphilic exporter-1